MNITERVAWGTFTQSLSQGHGILLRKNFGKLEKQCDYTFAETSWLWRNRISTAWNDIFDGA